jgi:hypothetical protein
LRNCCQRLISSGINKTDRIIIYWAHHLLALVKETSRIALSARVAENRTRRELGYAAAKWRAVNVADP